MKRLRKLPKKPNDYPRTTVRLPERLLKRMEVVRGKTQLSLGAQVVAALSNHLPYLEHKYGLVTPAAE